VAVVALVQSVLFQVGAQVVVEEPVFLS